MKHADRSSNLPLDDDALLALSNLSAGLWRIQELLELLAYRLQTQQLLVEAGRSRWLGRASREVESALAELRADKLLRAVDVSPVCEALGLPGDTSLGDIAAVAPTPWNDVLAQHNAAMSAATEQVTMLSRANSEMLDAGHTTLRNTMSRFNLAPEGHTPPTGPGVGTVHPTEHLLGRNS